MKIKITFKDPDAEVNGAIHYGMVRELVHSGKISEENGRNMPRSEIEECFEKEFGLTFDDMYEKVGKFVEYGEYLTIEVDTEKATATVLPVE